MGTEAQQIFVAPFHSAAATVAVSDGERVVVHVRGEIDMATAGTLSAVLTAVANSSEGAVVVDLSAATFFDTHGLRALLATESRMAGTGRAMVIRNPRHTTLRLLACAGVGHLVEAA